VATTVYLGVFDSEHARFLSPEVTVVEPFSSRQRERGSAKILALRASALLKKAALFG